MQTGPWLQLQVQLAPLLQVFLRLDPAYRGRMCGEAGGGWKRTGSQGGDAACEARTLARDSACEGGAQGTLPSWRA